MKMIRKTRSVCPVCLSPIPAKLVSMNNRIYLQKHCEKHGDFSVITWHGKEDFDAWNSGASPLGETEGLNCPANCGICSEHLQGSCCVLLEVTRRCNLSCRFCFADGDLDEPSLESLKQAADIILTRGQPLIQLSGGEPTMRDDLPELVKYIRGKGTRFIQLNSNGIRLADDEEYVKALADAGLSFVFMQFDGVTDDVYQTLRGERLLDVKRRAIEICGRHGLGVTLVPTVVRGVNDSQIGDMIRYGAALSPVVRGVHFQPVSYFGRYPRQPDDDERYTLDELLAALETQAGIKKENIMPSRCDHPSCGFHGSFVVMEDGVLRPLTFQKNASAGEMTSAQTNRNYIGTRWEAAPKKDSSCCCCCGGESTPSRENTEFDSIDAFAERVKTYGFTVTSMAFQDAMNLDIERLRRCSLHVYDNGALKPFCARYITKIGE